MTKDDIIKLAQEAGLCELRNGFADWIDAGPSLHEMTLFASLVAQQEREKCARICDELETCSDAEFYGHEFSAAIRARKNP